MDAVRERMCLALQGCDAAVGLSGGGVGMLMEKRFSVSSLCRCRTRAPLARCSSSRAVPRRAGTGVVFLTVNPWITAPGTKRVSF